MWLLMQAMVTNPALVPFGFGSPVRVLLVEDDADGAALIRAQMSQDADRLFAIEWKDNMLNAISRLAKPGIDVVLLDLGMPEVSGSKTHLAIATVTLRTPVVILTSDESAVSREATKAQGAFAYLVKQKTSPIELRQTLREAALSAPLVLLGRQNHKRRWLDLT
jgi:CheY-like chemotaxis protein